MTMAKTPVSILQELLQRLNKIPQYDLLPSEGFGTHNPTFHYRVETGHVVGFGKARSKKDAKHEAAKDALAKLTDLGMYIPEQSGTPPPQTPPVDQTVDEPALQVNAVGMLKDYVAEHKLPPPLFTEISDVGPAHQRLFTLQCTVGTLKKTATDFTKKKAKQACALLMYKCLLDSLPEVGDADEPPVASEDEPPSQELIMERFAKTTVNYGVKRRDNYKMKICEYPRMFNKMMTEKNLTYEDLWMNVDTNSAAMQAMEDVLQKLDLKASLEAFESMNKLVVVLSIESDPAFCIAKIAKKIPEAFPYLIREALKFLKVMTAQ